MQDDCVKRNVKDCCFKHNCKSFQTEIVLVSTWYPDRFKVIPHSRDESLQENIKVLLFSFTSEDYRIHIYTRFLTRIETV